MIELLGNLGDFVGGIAVLVTIGYLAVQLRATTIANRRATYQDLLNHQAQLNLVVLSDDAVANLLAKNRESGVEGLEPTEISRVFGFYATLFRHMENAYQQQKEGSISETQLQQLSTILPQALVRAEAWQVLKDSFSEDYQDYVETFFPTA